MTIAIRREFPVIAFLLFLVAGCSNTGHSPAGDSIEGALSKARESNQPVIAIVFDPARDAADRQARAAFGSAVKSSSDVHAVALDLTVSRNRAAAAPLHAVDAPTLVCLSPKGIIVSRDEGSVTVELIRERIARSRDSAPNVDREFSSLQAEVDAKPDDARRRKTLADFLLSHHNDEQAIPHLKFIAENESVELPARINAWVAWGRSHLWIIEPEKARYSAQRLITELGPRSPEAIAGGNLVRGLQDTRAKRYGRARDEFNTAIAAAPESSYGKEAAALLAKLPSGK